MTKIDLSKGNYTSTSSLSIKMTSIFFSPILHTTFLCDNFDRKNQVTVIIDRRYKIMTFYFVFFWSVIK